MDIIMKIDLIKFLNDFEKANPELQRFNEKEYTTAEELYNEYGCISVLFRPDILGYYFLIYYQNGVDSVINYRRKDAETIKAEVMGAETKGKEAENEN